MAQVVEKTSRDSSAIMLEEEATEITRIFKEHVELSSDSDSEHSGKEGGKEGGKEDGKEGGKEGSKEGGKELESDDEEEEPELGGVVMSKERSLRSSSAMPKTPSGEVITTANMHELEGKHVVRNFVAKYAVMSVNNMYTIDISSACAYSTYLMHAKLYICCMCI